MFLKLLKKVLRVSEKNIRTIIKISKSSEHFKIWKKKTKKTRFRENVFKICRRKKNQVF